MFALMVLAMLALLGTAAVVMDVGFAWYGKRQVQASADAAALAGAQQLPDIASATSFATTYATLNTPDNLSNVTIGITTGCSVAATASNWCGLGKTYQANKIAVTEKAQTPTWFAGLLGIKNFDVTAVATACQPCSSAPVDIMLVVDRTGSMCDPTGTGSMSGECIDLNNAKQGVQTMLGIMDPNIDTIGLVAFPPFDPTTSSSNEVCDKDSAPSSLTINGTSGVDAGYYDDSTRQYLNDPLASTFKTSATSGLNPASSLVQHMSSDTYNDQNCIRSFGSTSYDEALAAGQAELVKDGRKGVPKVIVFMTDGEANEGSYWNGVTPHGLEPDLADPTTSFNMSPASSASTINPGDAQPCQSAINAATAIKLTGTTIYTIGYDLFDSTSGYAYCVHGVWGQIDKSNATDSNDYTDFKCTKIGSTPTGKYKANNYALNPDAGHYQPSYPVPSPSSNSNPCINTKTGDHREMPLLTSYDTLASIATKTGADGKSYFYNKPTAGDVTSIFAAIAADITKGTSRLVDDGY
jgi:Flp pilus assembly protein TadG